MVDESGAFETDPERRTVKMKKIVANKDINGADESVTEKDVSDLTIKKLTLKTGVKAGRAGTCATSCCACTCHTN